MYIKTLFSLAIVFIFFLTSFGLSQERPETIVIPVSSVGDVTETRKLILQNTLEDELKTHFRLISQEKFEEAQEKAFQQLDYEECTEERCIILIQEMLQVENVFHLQVIGEGNDTQLSLSWRTLDEKRKEEEFCEGCGTVELRKMIIQLFFKLTKKPNQSKVIAQKKVNKEKISIEDTDSTISASEYNTSYIGLSIVYPIQYPSKEKNIKGFRLNYIGAYHESVNGVDFTWVGFSGTNKSKVMQFTFIGLNYTNEMDGLQMTYAGSNYSSKFATYQVVGIGYNYTKKVTLQLGLSLNIASKPTTQIGVINYSEYGKYQIGVINIAKYLKGFQLGLVNIVKNPIFPFGYVLPILNISF